jgi:hypothetical protein
VILVAKINEVYQKIRNELEQVLLSDGYKLKEYNIDEKSFGSQSVEYSCIDDFVRFIWDGKEEWFVLQWSPVVKNGITSWGDIHLEKYNTRNNDENEIDEIIYLFKYSLMDFLGISSKEK